MDYMPIFTLNIYSCIRKVHVCKQKAWHVKMYREKYLWSFMTFMHIGPRVIACDDAAVATVSASVFVAQYRRCLIWR